MGEGEGDAGWNGDGRNNDGRALEGSSIVKSHKAADVSHTSIQHRQHASPNVPISSEGPPESQTSLQTHNSLMDTTDTDEAITSLEHDSKAGAFQEAGRRQDGTWDWQALRKGFRDERGDMAFYDGSFVEDPWRGLLRGDEGGI